jgi:hypothetical protein
VRGRFDWTKLYLAMLADPAKMADAARQVAASGVWVVPTAIQADRALVPADSVRAWLTSPELRYIPADGRSVWEQRVTGPSARMDSSDWQSVARGRANRRDFLRALHSAGAKVAVGTDTPNPFVVPGFAVYEELMIFVDAGFSPREALGAATREPARLMGMQDRVGTIEVGKRADLLLLSSNPFADLRTIRSPVGVMAGGRWLPSADLGTMLQRLATP